MTRMLLGMAILATILGSCGNNKNTPAKGKAEHGYNGKLFKDVDTLHIKTEADFIAQYQKYAEIKATKKDILQDEPEEVISELHYFSFFKAKETEFMNFDKPEYKAMEKAIDSIDKVYGLNP